MWLWLKGFDIKMQKLEFEWKMYIYPSRCAEPKCGSCNSFLATVTTSRAEPDTMGYKVKAAPHRSTGKNHARPLVCTAHVTPGELNDSC